VDPVLPLWAPELILKNLRVGDATITLRFWPDRDGESQYKVLQRRGTVYIVRQPPINSLSVGIWDRIGVLVKDVIPL
jgi:hypothetical protein